MKYPKINEKRFWKPNAGMLIKNPRMPFEIIATERIAPIENPLYNGKNGRNGSPIIVIPNKYNKRKRQKCWKNIPPNLRDSIVEKAVDDTLESSSNDKMTPTTPMKIPIKYKMA